MVILVWSLIQDTKDGSDEDDDDSDEEDEQTPQKVHGHLSLFFQ